MKRANQIETDTHEQSEQDISADIRDDDELLLIAADEVRSVPEDE